jgi:hypothetical protein
MGHINFFSADDANLLVETISITSKSNEALLDASKLAGKLV